MLLHIKKLLDSHRIDTVNMLLKDAPFVNGKRSAGKEAQQVKNNVELSPQSQLNQQLNQIVMNSLVQHPQYQAAVFPLKIAGAFYARYTKGMQYGFHVDDPVMGPMNGRYRADIATTIFLNSREDYQGGELVIRTDTGEQRFKADVGDAIVYSANTWHRVTEVTQGTRLVAVTWAQSMIKDGQQRELLYELGQARDALLATDADSEITAKISTSYANLVRMWSDI